MRRRWHPDHRLRPASPTGRTGRPRRSPARLQGGATPGPRPRSTVRQPTPRDPAVDQVAHRHRWLRRQRPVEPGRGGEPVSRPSGLTARWHRPLGPARQPTGGPPPAQSTPPERDRGREPPPHPAPSRPPPRRPPRIPRRPRPGPAGCPAPRRFPPGVRHRLAIGPRRGPGPGHPRSLMRYVPRPRRPPPVPTRRSAAPLPDVTGPPQRSPRRPAAPLRSRPPTDRPAGGRPHRRVVSTLRRAPPVGRPADSVRSSPDPPRPVGPPVRLEPRPHVHRAPESPQTSPSQRRPGRRPARSRPRPGAPLRALAPRLRRRDGPFRPPSGPVRLRDPPRPAGKSAPSGPVPVRGAVRPVPPGCPGPAHATPRIEPDDRRDRRHREPPVRPRRPPPLHRSGPTRWCVWTRRRPT